MRNGISIAGVLFLLSAGTPAPGGELWKTPVGGDVWDLAPTGDLDGDGKNDVLAGAADNAVRALSGADGHVLWSYPAGGDVWCVASFPDLDGDQKPEAVAGTGGNEVLVISQGKLYWSFAAGGDVWCLAEMGDTNGDGVPELACGSGDNNVHCLDLKTKSLRWSRDLGGDVWSLAAAGKSLNADAVPDLVAGTGSDLIVALGGVGGGVIWDYPTLGDVWRVVLVGDVDNDSVPDVVAGTGGDRILCLPGKSSGHAPPFLWQSHAGSDIQVLVVAPDYDRDGLPEILAGGLDNVLRLLNGRTGLDRWSVDADGSIKDAIVGPDLDADGVPDVIYATDGSTVNAVSGSNKAPLWTHYAEIDATFWSLASLPDVDGDALADLAAGSALNEIIGLPSVPQIPPDSVNDLACVAAQTPGGPGVLLTWSDAPRTTSVRIFEGTGETKVLLGEVQGGVERLQSPLSGSADPREFTAISVGRGGESTPETCTATLAPPPVADLTCSADGSGRAKASWLLPDPGLRTLDGVRVRVDGVALALSPPAATSIDLGNPPPGEHTVLVATVWGPWESPSETCTFEAGEAGAAPFIRGDANTDGRLDIADGVSILLYLFLGKSLTCLAAVDGNGDHGTDISDAVYLLAFLFGGGGPPPAPYPACGVDRAIECGSFTGC
jgi:outer membrane protein assembly factor BamB